MTDPFEVGLNAVPIEIFAIGAGILILATYIVLYKFKFKNDPYFPPIINKYDKVKVIILDKSSAGISVMDVVWGKWGKHGLYLSYNDRLYPVAAFMSGKVHLAVFVRGYDGDVYPAGITVVDSDKNFIVSHPELKDIPALFTLIEPTIEDYKLAMKQNVEATYALAERQLLKNANIQTKGFFGALLQDFQNEKILMIILGIMLLAMYLVASDALTQAGRVCIEAAKAFAQTKGVG